MQATYAVNHRCTGPSIWRETPSGLFVSSWHLSWVANGPFGRVSLKAKCFFFWDKVELAAHTLKLSNHVRREMPESQLCQSCSSGMQTECLFRDVWGSLITAELIKQCHGAVCETSQVPELFHLLLTIYMKCFESILWESCFIIILSAIFHGIRWWYCMFICKKWLFFLFIFFFHTSLSVKFALKYCFESQKQASVYHYCTSVWPICSLRSAISGLQSKPSKQDCALSIGLLR